MILRVTKPGGIQGALRLATFLLAWCWFPATSHELLEMAGWIHHPQEADSTTGHDAADGHCRLQSGGILVKAPTVTTRPLPITATEFPVPQRATPSVQDSFFVHFSNAPPNLPRPWQFLRRAAPPSRAPCFT